MHNASATTLRAEAAASASASAQDIEDIAARINDELYAMQCVHESMSRAVSADEMQKLSDATIVISRTIGRLAQLRDALEQADLDARHAGAARYVAAVAEYSGTAN